MKGETSIIGDVLKLNVINLHKILKNTTKMLKKQTLYDKLLNIK